jgi:orotidine-5'-phosphate decarboxylase
MFFADRLKDSIARVGSPSCVGLDPVLESLPGQIRSRHHEPLGAIAEFSHGVLHAIAGVVPAVKFQAACFERYGSRGVALLEELAIEAQRLGLVIVYDAKRGDIGTTSAHYAAGAKRLGAHAITANGYLGRSGLTPFLDAGLGLFVLVRTSNPDSDEIQSTPLSDGRSVGAMLADVVASLGASHHAECGLSNVGAVVGATKSGEARALRERMPNQIFLIPGYGAQGGTAQDIRDMRRPGQPPHLAGVLVTASRSVIYAADEGGRSWSDAVSSAARRFATEIADACR